MLTHTNAPVANVPAAGSSAAQVAGVVVPGVLDSGDWELLTWCVVVCAVHHPV